MLARFLLAVCSLASLGCFVFPLYAIRPFRQQGPRELAAALFVMRIRPALSVICVLIALAVVVATWRSVRGKFRKLALVAALVLALAGAVLSRVNVYERMFHPLATPQFQAAGDTHIDKDDMVISVTVNREARAYPVREMAYHHVVNDTVGRQPIVATY